jgi:DNA transposition AAA+ family ATPase
MGNTSAESIKKDVADLTGIMDRVAEAWTSYLGTFVETGAWKHLQNACDTAINETAIVVVYGHPGVWKTRCLMKYVSGRMATIPISIDCSPNTTNNSFLRHLAHLVGADVRQQAHLIEIEIAIKLRQSPKAIFINRANYLVEKSLGTFCFLCEYRRLPMVLTGTKQLYDIFFHSKLTEDVRGQLSLRIAMHYLLPELTQTETRSILEQTLGNDATEDVIKLIHTVTGKVFCSIDTMIPRIMKLKQRNEQKPSDGTLKMQDVAKMAASRLMI